MAIFAPIFPSANVSFSIGVALGALTIPHVIGPSTFIFISISKQCTAITFTLVVMPHPGVLLPGGIFHVPIGAFTAATFPHSIIKGTIEIRTTPLAVWQTILEFTI